MVYITVVAVIIMSMSTMVGAYDVALTTTVSGESSGVTSRKHQNIRRSHSHARRPKNASRQEQQQRSLGQSGKGQGKGNNGGGKGNSGSGNGNGSGGGGGDGFDGWLNGLYCGCLCTSNGGDGNDGATTNYDSLGVDCDFEV